MLAIITLANVAGHPINSNSTLLLQIQKALNLDCLLFPWVTVLLLPIITKPVPLFLNLSGKQTLEGALPSQAAVTTEGLPLQSPKPCFLLYLRRLVFPKCFSANILFAPNVEIICIMLQVLS